MRKHFKLLFYPITVVVISLFSLVGCSDDDSDPDPIAPPILTTLSATDITETSAESGGNITDDGGGEITARGVVWGKEMDPSLENHTGLTEDGTGAGMFQSSLVALSPGATYYIRSYATNSAGTSYGNDVMFETIESVYQLTIDVNPAEGGNVTGSGEYQEGSEIGIAATANEGWVFDGWTGDTQYVNDPDLKQTVVVIPANDLTLTANFKEVSNIIYGDGVTDIDDNEYVTVIIGEQEWMAHNLRTTKYNNGSEIPTGLNNDDWGSTWQGAYAKYSHEEDNTMGIDSPEDMVEIYGLLYNRYAIEQENLCPVGWRVPSRDDWDELVDYLINAHGYSNSINDQNGVGSALKVARQVGHPRGEGYDTNEHPRWGGNSIYYGLDSFGFSGLPAGIRTSNGTYTDIGQYAYWWSSTEEDGLPMASPFARLVDIQNNLINSNIHDRSGLSVRCIKED